MNEESPIRKKERGRETGGDPERWKEWEGEKERTVRRLDLFLFRI